MPAIKEVNSFHFLLVYVERHEQRCSGENRRARIFKESSVSSKITSESDILNFASKVTIL